METDKILDYEINLEDIDLSWDVMPTSLTSVQSSAIPSGSYTINTSQFNETSGSYFCHNTTNPTISIGSSNPSGLDVHGDANFDGDIKVKGKSLTEFMETLEKRLAILQPDPEKLEHFDALQKAYEHYKTLEALCQLPKKDKE